MLGVAVLLVSLSLWRFSARLALEAHVPSETAAAEDRARGVVDADSPSPDSPSKLEEPSKLQEHRPSAAEFAARQHQRRKQTNAILAVLGLAIAIEPALRDIMISGWYWLGVVCLVLWVLGLAVVDLWTTQSYVSQVRAQHRVQRRILEAEVQRLRRKNHP